MTIDTISTFLIAARWIHFASVSILFGTALFRRVVERAEAGARGPSRTLAILAAVSGVAWLAGTIANVAGPEALLDPAMLNIFFFETPFGWPAIARLALLATLVLSAVVPMARRDPSLLLSVGGALLVSQAWFGHAAEGGRYGAAMLIAYAAHVLAAAAWAGSLPALTLAMVRGRKGSQPIALLARYSRFAIVCVAIVIASGITNTAFHACTSLGLLTASFYGKVLAVKLALVASMLALATTVRLVLMPRLLRMSMDAGTNGLSIILKIEAFLGVFLFGAAALLGMSPPPC